MALRFVQSAIRPVTGVCVAAMSVVGIGHLTSNALFTDSTVVFDNAFVTGKVDISTSDSWAVFESPALMPGDVIVQPLVISNDGTTEMRYALTSTLLPPLEVGPEGAEAPDADPDQSLEEAERLATQMDLSISAAPSMSSCSAANFDNLDEVLYGPDDFSQIAEVQLFGDKAQGFQGGERTVAAGRSEVLCLKVSLPLETGDSFENLEASAFLVAYAEQTKNND